MAFKLNVPQSLRSLYSTLNVTDYSPSSALSGSFYKTVEELRKKDVEKNAETTPEKPVYNITFEPIKYSLSSLLDSDYTSSAKVEDLRPYIEEMHEKQTAAKKAALEKLYDQKVLGLNDAEAKIAPVYAKAKNETAAASELSKKNFNEYANARGLNSGSSSQEELARGIALRNELNLLNNSESGAYADINLERAKAKSEYDSAVEQALAEGELELAKSLLEESIRVQNALMSQMESAMERKLSAQKVADDLAYKYAALNYQKEKDTIDRTLKQET